MALREGFLVADAFSIDVSGTDIDPYKRPCSGSTVHSKAVSVAPSDLCIMRDRPREVCMVSSGRALLKPTGSSPWLELLGPCCVHDVETSAAAEAHDPPG